jgi:isopenicillin-N epimerase
MQSLPSSTDNLFDKDWPDFRSFWNLAPTIAHLNHGSFGAVPRKLKKAQNSWQTRLERNPNGFIWSELEPAMELVRRRVSTFLNTSPNQLLLTSNITNAISTVLASTTLLPGDEILITEDTYPGVKAAVAQAALRFQACVVVVDLPSHNLTPLGISSAILEHVSPHTRLAIIDHITSPTAILLDVTLLTKELHQKGVKVAIDGAHATGSIPVDINSIGADFYVGNFHKWCCSPHSSACLAFSQNSNSLLPGIPGLKDNEGFPQRFEWAGTLDYSAILATPDALSFFDKIGWQRTREQNTTLVAYGARIVSEFFEQIAPAESQLPMQVVSIPSPFKNLGSLNLRNALAKQGVEVAVVDARNQLFLRLSAHLYNRPSDYQKLVKALKKLK